MDVRVEDLGSVRKKIHVVVPKDVVEKEIDGFYSELKKTAKIKGFRPGKIPRQILERYYRDHMKEQVVSRIIQNTFEKALSESKISPVSPPDVDSEGLQEGESFKYSAVVEVNPEIQVNDYIGIPLKGKQVSLQEDAVDKRLKELQNLHAQLKPIEEDRAARSGDLVVIDFRGTMNEKPFEGGKGENVSVEIGGGRFPKDFEEGLIGTRPGDKKEIDIIFPEDHPQKTLAGKRALFRLKIREIREKVLPPVDGEFAKDLGYETLKAVREKIKSELEEEQKSQINRDLENQIVDYLLKKHDFETPQSLVDHQIEAMIRDLKLNLVYRGVDLKATRLDDDKLKAEYRDGAVREVKFGLLLGKIAEMEKISVSDEEIGREFEEIGKRSDKPKDQVEAYYKKNNLLGGLKARLLRGKTVQFLIDKAEMSYDENV